MPKKHGVIIGYRYRVDGTLLNEHRWTFDEENRLVLHEIEFSESKKKGSQRFVYVDGLLERVIVKNWGQSWAITHDALGRLETISEVWSGTQHEIYRRPAKGEKLSDLLALIRERLLALIPKVVAKAKPKSVAYALAIAVDTEEWRYPLPPSLALAFEDDRKRFAKNHPDNVRQFLWSVAELPCFDVEELDLRDERLTEACTRANQHLWKGGDQGQVTPFLRKIAKELQGVDFRALRSVSDDFFVYVTSLESDGWPDARRDAPPEIKKRLIARGEL